jgi:hypothetical protein
MDRPPLFGKLQLLAGYDASMSPARTSCVLDAHGRKILIWEHTGAAAAVTHNFTALARVTSLLCGSVASCTRFGRRTRHFVGFLCPSSPLSIRSRNTESTDGHRFRDMQNK